MMYCGVGSVVVPVDIVEVQEYVEYVVDVLTVLLLELVLEAEVVDETALVLELLVDSVALLELAVVLTAVLLVWPPGVDVVVWAPVVLEVDPCPNPPEKAK